MKRAASLLLVALAACSEGSTPTAGTATPPGLGPAEQGAEASAAIAAATRCVQEQAIPVDNRGYLVLFEQATAHRDASDRSRWIVAFPPGMYLGRLPPPGPGQPLLIAVDPRKDSRCTTLFSAARAQ